MKNKTKVREEKPWHWPYLRHNIFNEKEYACRHGVGHGGVHGCDGCCRDSNFRKKAK